MFKKSCFLILCNTILDVISCNRKLISYTTRRQEKLSIEERLQIIMKMQDRYRYEDKLVILTLYENIEYKIDYLITEQARSSSTQRPMRFFEHLRIFWLFQNYQCGFYLIISQFWPCCLGPLVLLLPKL